MPQLNNIYVILGIIVSLITVSGLVWKSITYYLNKIKIEFKNFKNDFKKFSDTLKIQSIINQMILNKLKDIIPSEDKEFKEKILRDLDFILALNKKYLDY